MRRHVGIPAAVAPAIAGCGADEQVGKLDAALSRPGPRDIPDETAAVGDTQYVEYTGAGPWVGESSGSASSPSTRAAVST